MSADEMRTNRAELITQAEILHHLVEVQDRLHLIALQLQRLEAWTIAQDAKEDDAPFDPRQGLMQ
jgi:hypothetical protein